MNQETEKLKRTEIKDTLLARPDIQSIFVSDEGKVFFSKKMLAGQGEFKEIGRDEVLAAIEAEDESENTEGSENTDSKESTEESGESEENEEEAPVIEQAPVSEKVQETFEQIKQMASGLTPKKPGRPAKK